MHWPAEPLLVAFLAAQRSGTLAELLAQRPRLTRWLARQLLAPLRRVAGDAVEVEALSPQPWLLLLRAALAELRPDGQGAVAGLAEIDEVHWLRPGPWRALLALACQQGLLPVPSVAQHYRARPDEPPAEQLCGLWDVGASTVYRAVDKGRRQLASALARPLSDGPADGAALLRRQHGLQTEVYALRGLDSLGARLAWHGQQAERALAAHDGVAALWHLGHAGDAAGFVACLQRHAVALANRPDTDALVRRFAALPIDDAARVQLALAQAALGRVRGNADAEREACERAVRLAGDADDPLLLGRAYGALGRHHEVRDNHRAFACFQQSAEFLRQAGLPESATGHDSAANAALLDEYVNTLVRLAWWYVLRNDPRARPLLDRAQALEDQHPRAAEAQALLAQAWGEYWRRSGDLPRALEFKYRALQIYERLGDQQALLKTYSNLALIHGEAKDLPRAADYSQRVLDMAQRFQVEPETLAATLLNLGAAYYWQNRWDQAIGHYEQGLDIATRAGLTVLVGRAHYNLAEACYKRFQALDRADDERRGDAHTAAALATWPAEGDAAPIEATRALKHEILGQHGDTVDRLLPGEFAAHFPELLAVQRHRAALALPLPPDEQVAAHLAIARAYLAVSVKEREAAVGLIDQHGLAERFDAELGQLQTTFHRALNREQQLAVQWRAQAGDLLGDAACAALLRHLLRDGAVGKSGYAPLVGVGLATASKQLGLLTSRGLLRQTGKGPRTRYLLSE